MRQKDLPSLDRQLALDMSLFKSTFGIEILVAPIVALTVLYAMRERSMQISRTNMQITIAFFLSGE